MHRIDVSLDDKYEAEQGEVLISGVQALVRLPLDQIRRDRRAGLKTSGFISGYRGSPLGGYDQQLARAKTLLDAHQIHVEAGVNEDLAATAVWGSQQVNLHPGATVPGVFGLWYGKAPGVDRSGDVFKHANMAGSWHQGGVLAIAGDDPLAKSSTLPCQSEFAFIDAEIPVLAPASIQDVLDLGLHGIALSRHSGLWSGMIALADIMDGSATVNVDHHRLAPVMPVDDEPDRHITLQSLQLRHRHDAEQRLRQIKIPAALDYARRNRLNHVVWDSATPRLGIAASGKNWQALMAALDMLAIDRPMADRLGLRLMKIGMHWPLEPDGIENFARGLGKILVIEAKRPLIEPQIKDQLYHIDNARRPAIVGKKDQFGLPLLSDIGDLSPLDIAPVLLNLLPSNEITKAMQPRLQQRLERLAEAKRTAAPSSRAPHFCSGCPHSRSTRVPAGSRMMAGIGCHIMSQSMGGEARGFGQEDSFSQMGGEGVAWIGQRPFTETSHVFVNLGDGTYHHSGILAIRAAVAAKAQITYKILFNDAVAMTGGQSVDGTLTVAKIVRQVQAEGVEKVVVLSEQPDQLARTGLAGDVDILDRDQLQATQRQLRAIKGVSVLIFDQTCAAEKRRRRKKGLYPKSRQLAVINERVCEGCGDCSLQSNCPSVEPLPTSYGVKRRVNQSSCNQDLSCTDGFCPSFLIVENAEQKSTQPHEVQALIEAAADLPEPRLAKDEAVFNLVIPGVGGTGVTTISAILAMAAHLDGKTAATLDVTGLAQKGGAVFSFLRLGPAGVALHGARIAAGGADLVIACDQVVAASAACLALCDPRRTLAIADDTIMPTAAFTLGDLAGDQDEPTARYLADSVLMLSKVKAGDHAEALLGDAIYSNMMLVGAAFQKDLIPLSLAAIERAIRLNGVAIEKNLAAFHAGRLLEAAPNRLPPLERRDERPSHESLDSLLQRLSDELVAYADETYAERFRTTIATARFAETALGLGGSDLTRAVADNLFKLMAYKDEYEVARLLTDPDHRARLRQQFGPKAKISFKLAPPLLSRTDPKTGRPEKKTFGPWIYPLLRGLARLKPLRGHWFDPFGWTEERRLERRLIDDYERTIGEILSNLSDQRLEAAVEIASLPASIRGFGPVKLAAIKAAKARQQVLLAAYTDADQPGPTQDPTWLIAAE